MHSFQTTRTAYNRASLVNQTFPGGTVVAFYMRKEGRAHWWVICPHCGERYTVSTHVLRSGRKKSCGCLNERPKRTPLEGRTFGRGTVERYLYTEETNAIWELRCECGEYYKASTNDLTQGKIQSCGCLQKERVAEANITRALLRRGLTPPGPDTLSV